MLFRSALGVCALAIVLQNGTASAITITNGIAGVGGFAVNAGNAGDSTYGAYNAGTGLADQLYGLDHYISIGGGPGVWLQSAGTITQPEILLGSTVFSSGFFAGPNGQINWTALATIASSSTTYSVSYLFSSANNFGAVRFGQYMDADIVGAGSDNLIELGVSGQPGFELRTVDTGASTVFGLGQSADFLNTTNMTYVGWAARPYSQLLNAITGGTVTYSIPGIVTNLSSTTDSRYPGSPAYGPADVTSAIAFDLNPHANSASVTFTMGTSNVPEPGTWSLIAVGAVLVGLGRRRK